MSRFIPDHLRSRRKGETGAGLGRAAGGDLMRGVVIATVEPDSPAAVARLIDRPFIKDNGIKCDVLVYETDKRFILSDVPVATDSGGVADYVEWRPRATTLALTTGQPLNVAIPIPGLPPTPTHEMDGDHVLVGFVDDDYNKPVIVGQIPHPRTFRAPSFTEQADPTWPGPFKYRRFLKGMTFGVTEGGNVDLNLSAASTGELIPGPVPAEVPTPGRLLSGNITITMFTGDLVTGTKLQVLDSVVSAPEAVMRGQTYLTDENAFLGSLSLALTEIQTAFTGLGLPTLNIAACIAQIAVFQGVIGTSLGVGFPYLSSHVEVD